MALEHDKARAKGAAAEWLATIWLAAKGYRILARQFRAHGGELDIVAVTPFWTKRTIVFVEVRARATVDQAYESVGALKRRRVQSAASQFCARKPRLGALPRRFDLVLLAPGRWPQHMIDVWKP